MSCDGACATCGGLADRIAALEGKIATLEARGTADQFPAPGLVGISDIERRAGADRSTINRWIRAGKFPKPVAWAGNRRRWRVTDIEKWEAERTARRHVSIIRGVVAQRRAEAEAQGASRAV